MDEFSHVDGEKTTMVDVSDKPDVRRESTAAGEMHVRPTTVDAIREGGPVKDDVLATARIAAIQGIKRTWDDIPLCHQIPITDTSVDFELDDDRITARVTVASTGKTGVEMEALNGVTRALLTVWDMVKAAEKDDDGQYPAAAIQNVRVEEKRKEEVDPSEET